MARNIILLASLDTKGPEAQFLHDCIEEQGIDCTLLNIGYGRPRTIDADITAAEVAAATGADIAEVRGMHDTGAASNLMMQGATASSASAAHRMRHWSAASCSPCRSAYRN